MNSALVVLYEEMHRLRRYIALCEENGVVCKDAINDYIMLYDIFSYAQNKYGVKIDE